VSRSTCPICGGAPRGAREVVRAGAVEVCGACGSWYRVPRPTPAELLAIYDRGYYDAWGLDQDASIARTTKRATFEPTLRRVASRLNRAAQPRILDVGAATGLLCEMAAERGWEPWALELNPYAAEVLRAQLGAERVFEGELEACSFATQSFDAIFMTDLIEHVLDVGATLRAAARLLRDGGVLAITTPRIDSHSRALLGRNWLHFKVEHVQYFSRQGMQRALRDAGFQDVEIQAQAKRLTFDYLHTQLSTYPHPLLTPVANVARRALVPALRRWPVPYRCGEMRATAVRKG